MSRAAKTPAEAQQETEALRALIEATEAERGPAISRLGYFCAPFRPPAGPYADKVIKVYRGHGAQAHAERLADAHGAYLAVIRASGVTVPETQFHILETADGRIPVIVQAALPADSMMRSRIQTADAETALALMQAAGEVIAGFWDHVAGLPERVGFHPSIRNLAVIDGEGVFFDTFPPLIGYSHAEIGRLLVDFSSTWWIRALAPAMRGRVHHIQDEWYCPVENLVGLVGSACRLRPEYSAAFLDWGREFACTRMSISPEEIVPALAEPPRLSGLWTTVRGLLGLQGAPNAR